LSTLAPIATVVAYKYRTEMNPNNQTKLIQKIIALPQSAQIITQDIQTLNHLSNALFLQHPYMNKSYIPNQAFNTLNPTRSIYQHLLDIQPMSMMNVHALCKKLHFPIEKLNYCPSKLSLGLCQVAAIMLALSPLPKIIIINQPLLMLDKQRKEALITFLNSHCCKFVFFNTDVIQGLQTSKPIYLDKPAQEQMVYIKQPKSNQALIKLRDVTINHLPISPITVDLFQELTGLIGPNGSGKTSLAHAIMHSLPFSGTIEILGQHLSTRALYEKRYLQIMFQNVTESFVPNQPLNSILNEQLNIDTFFEILSCFPTINEWKNKMPKEVSVLTLKTLSFARIMARSPKFIILDEPFSNSNQDWSTSFLQVLSDKKISGLIIDHDTEMLSIICNQLYALNKGKLHAL
jgi:ABC-type dipeptide/oligopeptide/nickel transport system ATPase subunit